MITTWVAPVTAKVTVRYWVRGERRHHRLRSDVRGGETRSENLRRGGQHGFRLWNVTLWVEIFDKS